MNNCQKRKVYLIVIFSMFCGMVSFKCLGEIVSGLDAQKKCRYYRLMTNEVTFESLGPGEIIIDRGIYYNFYFRDLRIDFFNKLVWLKIVKNRTLGLNLLLFDDEFSVAANNPQFEEIMKTFGRGLALGIQPELVCLQGKKLVYVTFPENSSVSKSNKLPDYYYPEPY